MHYIIFVDESSSKFIRQGKDKGDFEAPSWSFSSVNFFVQLTNAQFDLPVIERVGVEAVALHCLNISLNPRNLEEKIVTRSLAVGGGGCQSDPPSTFDLIYPIDMKLGTYNKVHLYFQLSETTWCLIGFHGNNSQINDVISGRHLGF